MNVAHASHTMQFTGETPALMAVLNAMPGNLIILAADPPRFTILAASDEYLQTQNLQREAILGKTVEEIFFQDGRNNDVRDHLLVSLQNVINTGKDDHMPDQLYSSNYTVPGKFYSRIWRPINRPVFDAEGQLVCIIHSVLDVTETRQLMEVKQVNEYLQTILNLFREPLQILEPVFENGDIVDFRFQFTNHAYSRYANTKPELLQGKRVSEVFPGYLQTVSFSKPVETYKTGEPQAFEIHYDQDGLDLYNQMTTSRLPDGNIVINFFDFTHMKQLQVQLEQKIEALHQANQQLQNFAFGASHDLREPVRKINLLADRLLHSLGDRLTSQERQQFSRMAAAGVRMDNLISALLAFHEADQNDLPTELLDLNDILQQVIADLDMLVEAGQAVINTEQLPTITGRRRQWEQVFQNLVGNALKYTRPGVPPVIDITCRDVPAKQLPFTPAPGAAKTWHLLTIKDNGIGFNPEDAERIFDVFTRLHGHAVFEGSGIGLATAKNVIGQHGGHIWATSKPGEGSSFFITIPANTGTAQ